MEASDDSDTDRSEDYSEDQAEPIPKRSYAVLAPDSEPQKHLSCVHTCSVCQQRFPHKDGLFEHLKGHIEKRWTPPSSSLQDKVKPLTSSDLSPCNCSVCGKKFSFRVDLEKHVASVHTCSVCEQSFTDQGSLFQHIKAHMKGWSPGLPPPRHPDRPFSCSECSRRFQDDSALELHVLSTHRGQKPYRCPFCDKALGHEGSLKRHIKKHSGEKPFICSVCKKGFALNSQLKEHRKIHVEKRPFGCSVCDRTFVEEKDLSRHRRYVHHICPHCEKRFKERTQLLDHMTAHKTQ